MSRNRTIYQSEAVFVGPTGQNFSSGNSGSNLIEQLYRVQSFNSSLTVNRTDVNQFGELAAIDRIITEAPVVPLDFSYFLTNGGNERKIGLDINGNYSSISGILTKVSDEHNYYLLTTPEGTDAVGNSDVNNSFVTAFGNGFLTNYTAEASVGGFATASVSVEALNMRIYVGSTGKVSPTVNPTNGIIDGQWLFSLPTAVSGAAGEPTAISQGDIILELANPGIGVDLSGAGAAHIQSFSINVPLSRENLSRLGTKFAYSKELSFPITVSMNISAILSDLKSGALDEILCSDSPKDLRVRLKEPNCQGGGNDVLIYTLKGAKLDSQSFSSSIGGNKTVDMTFSAQIGSALQVNKGLFISGSE